MGVDHMVVLMMIIYCGWTLVMMMSLLIWTMTRRSMGLYVMGVDHMVVLTRRLKDDVDGLSTVMNADQMMDCGFI